MSCPDSIPLLTVKLKAGIGSCSCFHPSCSSNMQFPLTLDPVKSLLSFLGVLGVRMSLYMLWKELCLVILLSPWERHAHGAVQRKVITCWNDLNVHTDASPTLRGSVQGNDFRYTEEQQKMWLVFPPLQDEAWDVLRTVYLSHFGLNHQSALPSQLHSSHTHRNANNHPMLLNTHDNARNWFSALHTLSKLILTWGVDYYYLPFT